MSSSKPAKSQHPSAKAIIDVDVVKVHPDHPEGKGGLDDVLTLATGQPLAVEGCTLESTSLNSLLSVQASSRIFSAIIEAGTFKLQYANPAFCRLTGLKTPSTNGAGKSAQRLTEVLAPCQATPGAGTQTLEQLYRRYLLYQIFQQLYRLDIPGLQVLTDPLLFNLNPANSRYSHWIEFWFTSPPLKITRIDPNIDEFADLELQYLPFAEQQLLTEPAKLTQLSQRLRLENYQVEGLILLEGKDVTRAEWSRRITELLINRDSILQCHKFRKLTQGLCSLFQAQHCFLLRIKGKEAQVFIDKIGDPQDSLLYSLDTLGRSCIIQATEINQVLNIPDFWQVAETDCDLHFKQLGVRSLLLLPLVVHTGTSQSTSEEVLGVIGVTSDRIHHFNTIDCQQATQLVPAFTAALSHAIQQRFTNLRNIHPAVAWKFMQEAERRSWGLPPETIAFDDVYPLYGISDIRGSSEERNRAIQNDLLAQFELGLKIVETAYQSQETAFTQQLCQDLRDYIALIQEKVTVEMEVQAAEYLKQEVEANFDYFCQCGEEAEAAVFAYQAACDNEHGCIYEARSRYDQMLQVISFHLQATWEWWQERMQNIIAHHCDFEITDGIDHMLYVGATIDPKFTHFHLKSLRYEQLRAICDCARMILKLQAESEKMLGLAHLILVQNSTIDIYHNETTEKLFDVRGSRDIRYEIVKKRIDKAVDKETKTRITQSGMLTVVFSTDEEWQEYRQYLNYLMREGWIESDITLGFIEPLQGVSGLRFAQVKVIPGTPLSQTAEKSST